MSAAEQDGEFRRITMRCGNEACADDGRRYAPQYVHVLPVSRNVLNEAGAEDMRAVAQLPLTKWSSRRSSWAAVIIDRCE